LLYISICF